MNKKNKYVKTNTKEKMDSLELFFLFYDQGLDAEGLYRRHRDEFLTLWKEHYPGTRPEIFWKQEYPEIYQRLEGEAKQRMRAADSCVYHGIDLDDAKKELMQLEVLDPDEYNAVPEPACFRELRDVYCDD